MSLGPSDREVKKEKIEKVMKQLRKAQGTTDAAITMVDRNRSTATLLLNSPKEELESVQNALQDLNKDFEPYQFSGL